GRAAISNDDVPCVHTQPWQARAAAISEGAPKRALTIAPAEQDCGVLAQLTPGEPGPPRRPGTPNAEDGARARSRAYGTEQARGPGHKTSATVRARRGGRPLVKGLTGASLAPLCDAIRTWRARRHRNRGEAHRRDLLARLVILWT